MSAGTPFDAQNADVAFAQLVQEAEEGVFGQREIGNVDHHGLACEKSVPAGKELIDVAQPGVDRRFRLDHERVERSAAKLEGRGWPRCCHFVNPRPR